MYIYIYICVYIYIYICMYVYIVGQERKSGLYGPFWNL